MRLVAISIRVVGLLFVVGGILLVADAVLPMRSRGPNPSWIEFGAGAIFAILGWRISRYGAA